MKKKLLILLVLLLFMTGCGKKEEEPKPKLTLDIMAELVPDTYGTAKIKCTPLKTYDVVGTLSGKILLSNGYLYSIGSLYSNNEQCMQVSDMQFSKVLEGGYLLGVDGKLYSAYDLKPNTYNVNVSAAGYVDWVEIKFTEQESLVYKSSSTYVKGNYTSISYNKFYALKNDGNIYVVIYKITNNHKTGKKTASLVTESVIYSASNFGPITDFAVSNSTNKEINMIFSPNGLYVLKQIETEECLKYEDVMCETKMSLVTDYSYDKYKSEIKYYDKNYVITKENSILQTNFVFNLTNSRQSYAQKFADYEE